MLPLLRVALEGETSVPAAEAEIADQLRLSAEEREQRLPSGRQRVLHNRIHWSKLYLARAGLLETPSRGRFAISESGRRLLESPPPKLDTEWLKSIPAFQDFYRRNVVRQQGVTPELPTSKATPEEVVEQAYDSIQAELKAEILERILRKSPAFFERVVVDLLVGMGYGGSHADAALQLGRSGDGGIDGVINEDVLGLDRVYVQAKRYDPDSTVGAPAIQGFTGSLVGRGASKGVFVTTSSFSKQAFDFVSRIPQRVVLIDGERLTERDACSNSNGWTRTSSQKNEEMSFRARGVAIRISWRRCPSVRLLINFTIVNNERAVIN